MRILALAILAIGTVSIGPAAAQTYDPAYPVCLHKYGQGAVQLLRLQLHVAASVQRVGIGPRGTVRHQSLFRGRGRAPGATLSAASSRLLNSASEFSQTSTRIGRSVCLRTRVTVCI